MRFVLLHLGFGSLHVDRHPRDNAWIAKDGDKCDRVDAYKLAELLCLNSFKEVHYAPDQPRRNFKQLVQHYDELTAHQARWKTKLKARLRMQGVIVTGERFYSHSGRKTLLAKVESRTVRTALSQLYEILDQSVAAREQARLLIETAYPLATNQGVARSSRPGCTIGFNITGRLSLSIRSNQSSQRSSY